MARVFPDNWSTPWPSEPGAGHRERWSKPRAIRPEAEPPGSAGRQRGPSEQGPSRTGLLVDTGNHRNTLRNVRETWSTPRSLGPWPMSARTAVGPAGPRAQARGTWDSWSMPRALRPELESPGRAGQLLRPSDPSLRHPGQLVDTADPRTWERVVRDSWSTPRPLEPGPRSPETFGQSCATWDTGQSRPG